MSIYKKVARVTKKQESRYGKKHGRKVAKKSLLWMKRVSKKK